MSTSRLGAEIRLGPRDQQDQDGHAHGETEARASKGPTRAPWSPRLPPALFRISGRSASHSDRSGLRSRLQRSAFPMAAGTHYHKSGVLTRWEFIPSWLWRSEIQDGSRCRQGWVLPGVPGEMSDPCFASRRPPVFLSSGCRQRLPCPVALTLPSCRPCPHFRALVIPWAPLGHPGLHPLLKPAGRQICPSAT